MTNGAMTTDHGKATGIRDLLYKSKDRIAQALPKHCTPERMLAVAMTAIQRTPKLLDCSPQSVIGAIVQASQLGLEVDQVLGHAYLVPFFNSKTKQLECQLIPGYKGLVDMARRSGKLAKVTARIVFENDTYEFHYGLDEKLIHRPSQTDEPGPMIAAYAVATMTDGTQQFEWMWKRQIDKIRDGSPASKSGPWVTDYDEMAKKTALRRLCKLLPASTEIQKAVALDELEAAGISQGMSSVVDFEPTDTPTTLDALAEDIDGHPEPTTPPTTDTPLSEDEDILITEYRDAIEECKTIGEVDQLGNTTMERSDLSDAAKQRVVALCNDRKASIKGKRGTRSN